MSIFFRVNFLSLVLAFVTFSCSPAKPITPSTMTPVPQVASETPALIVIPKQNDLIFIEFFAGT
jgi:hypothetical protein